MNVLYFVLYLLALVCFVFEALDSTVRRVSLMALGLAFAVTPLMLMQLQKL